MSILKIAKIGHPVLHEVALPVIDLADPKLSTLIGDMIEYCAEKVPSWYPVSISGYHMREAGCTATQEVALDGITRTS